VKSNGLKTMALSSEHKPLIFSSAVNIYHQTIIITIFKKGRKVIVANKNSIV
jgi:hypothetical protein